MMTGYQKQKLDELIHLLAVGLTWMPCDEDCFKRALRLAKEIREPPSEIETSAESSIMNAYFQYEKEEGK